MPLAVFDGAGEGGAPDAGGTGLHEEGGALGERGAGRHDVVDEQDRAPPDPRGAHDGEGVAEVVLAGVAGEAGLVFGVEGADERGVVEAAVEALREGLGEKGALVVAAFAQTVGMERNGDDDIDFGEGELRAHRPLQEVHQILAKPGRPVELEVLDQLADGALVEKRAAGACVVRRFLLAGLADERMDKYSSI